MDFCPRVASLAFFGTIRPVAYEQFFGFAESPFSLSDDTRYRFASASHESALAEVTHALGRREPVVVVTGEIGLGKTFLCRTVIERLPRKVFLSIVHDPMLGRDDLLKRILEDFGVLSANSASAANVGRHELVNALEKFLASLAQIDAHAVVILDEAQHLQPEVLEQIRLLANIHDDRGTLLQIVLVGQPDLQALLDRPELQQLRQRVTRSVALKPLTDEEVQQYVLHRMMVARETPTKSTTPGAHDLARAIAEWDEASRPAVFTADALRSVVQVSHGVPRLVNLVCDRALEIAHGQQSRTVDAVHLADAAFLLRLPIEPAVDASPVAAAAPAASARSGASRLAAAAALVAIVGAVVWFAVRSTSRAPRPQPAPVSTSAPPRAPEAAPPPTPAASSTSTAPDASTASPSAAPTEPAPRPADTPAAVSASPAQVPTGAPGGAEGFEIVVASFHTEGRANDVAKQIAASGQPVRQRSIGGWQQVVAGPFASKAAADEAQQQLDRLGFPGLRVVRETR